MGRSIVGIINTRHNTASPFYHKDLEGALLAVSSWESVPHSADTEHETIAGSRHEVQRLSRSRQCEGQGSGFTQDIIHVFF
jgi:hypothetical protein